MTGFDVSYVHCIFSFDQQLRKAVAVAVAVVTVRQSRVRPGVRLA